MKLPMVFNSVPALCAMFFYLVVYSVCIVLMFRTDNNGRRRRWHALDYIWIPLGGVTGVCLVALWWKMH
jgi:sensor c-di-GMP phosphodiesterase-like protein